MLYRNKSLKIDAKRVDDLICATGVQVGDLDVAIECTKNSG